MGFGAGDVVGLIWNHPIASVVVALLFTPPLFPIVVFFSPLLISTALVVLAMISMGSDGEDSGGTSGGYGNSHYKRDWHEQEETDQMSFVDDEDGPLLNDEDRRLHKRRKGTAALSHDDGWFDTVKSWEETGRAWVDSVLHQESRKPNSEPLFSPPTVTETREVRFAQPVPQAHRPSATTSATVEFPPPAATLFHSTHNVPPLEKEPAASAAAAAGASDDDQSRTEAQRRPSEISVEPEEEVIEIPAHSLRAFPLPDEKKSKSSEDRGDELIRPKVKWDEEVPVPVSSAAGADVVPEVIGANKLKEQHKFVETDQIEKVVEPREEVITVPESKGDSPSDRTHENRSVDVAQSEPSSSTSGGNAVDTKSAPSSSAAQGRGSGGGEHHRTPSVAVTLSEKLNVPLEDMMSLLAGDEKPSSSSGGSAAAKGSDDGGWSSSSSNSSSDDEAVAARAATSGGEQNQTSEKST